MVNKNADDIKTEMEALDQNKVDKIISLSNILYKTAFANNDYENMIDALEYLSMANLSKGNNLLAIEYLDNAIGISTENIDDQKVLVDLIKLKGNHYFDIEEYDKAATTYYQALEIAKDINYLYGLWALHTNLGFVKLRSGDPKKALEDLKISVSRIPEISKKDPFLAKRNLMITKARICEAYIKMQYLDSALLANDEGLAITKLAKVDNAHIDLLMHRGILFMEKNDYDIALRFLEEAKNLSNQANDVIFLGKILNLMAECHYEKKKYEISITILLESLKILNKEYFNSDELSRCYKLLGQSYKKIGNLEKSNEYYEKHILSLSKLNSKKSNASRKVRDATFKNFKNEIETLENQKRKQKNSLTYSQIGLAVFGSGLIMILFFFQKAKRKNKQKFNELLSKIETHENTDKNSDDPEISTSNSIIDTKDKKLDSHNNEIDINDEVYEQILDGLTSLESKEYYLKKECNLYNVAKKINTNTSYLSKVINAHFGKNFNTYINDLRINYAIIRLKNDSKFRSFSVKSIAEEVGYKSADSFSKYFKIHTGLLPSFYIKRLKSKHNKT
ncbi:tetratricopeptide repeat protein [Aquimarina sp. MMG016]|nr:tetratricopeptide repeat protein [Aquimarina sp. MMG016]